jgi:hypothetical protein
VGALESSVVAAIVATCTLFSVWRLLSVRMRLQALELLSGLPRYAGGALVARLRQKTIGKLSGGCGACSRAVGPVNATFPPANRRPAAPHR